MYTQYMYNDSLAHHGIKGMKWGVRRYQNPDGTLTAEGRLRYGIKSGDSEYTKKMKRDLASLSSKDFKRKYKFSNSDYMKSLDRTPKQPTAEQLRRKKNIKKAVAVTAGVALGAAAIYAGTKYVKNKKIMQKTVSELLREQKYAESDLKNLFREHNLHYTDPEVIKAFNKKEAYKYAIKREQNFFKNAPFKYEPHSDDLLNKSTSKVLTKTSKGTKATKSTIENLMNQNALSKLKTNSKATRKELADELFNKYSPMGPQRSKGLRELVKATGLSGSELEEQGLIKLSGNEIADLSKHFPDLWNKR